MIGQAISHYRVTEKLGAGDLKPANVRVTRDVVVKLLDFSLAKVFADDLHDPDLPHSATLIKSPRRESQKIDAVVLNGRLLDRKALDDLLAQAEAAARKD